MIVRSSSSNVIRASNNFDKDNHKASPQALDQKSLSTPNLTKAPLNRDNGLAGMIKALVQIVVLMLSFLAESKNTKSSAPSQSEQRPAANESPRTDNTTVICQDPQARLNNTLNAISQDTEGSKLLDAAKAKGYSFEVGDPAAAVKEGGVSLDKKSSSCSQCKAALDAGKQINGVTLPEQKKIVINPNAPDFEKTLVHELVHAATDEDGNSQQEEGIADVIGYRVASRITGEAQPGSPQSIYKNKINNYPELQQSNSIRSTLASLRITPGI